MDLIGGRYELLEVAGRGGQGEVHRALDHRHERIVALKIRPAGRSDERDRLLGEARLLLSLPPHANLPLVRDDFFWDDGYVIVMDWVDGTDLATVVARRGDPGLSPATVIGWLGQVAGALGHLHDRRPAIVHGDVKPANCVLTGDGRVVLVDFGISRPAGPAPTATGGRAWYGSAGFAAPEAVAGDAYGTAADIYGLSATAVALLNGSPPDGTRPRWEGIPAAPAAAIERAVRRGLATDPAGRPGSARELVDQLGAGLDPDLPRGVVSFLSTGIDGAPGLWEEQPESMGQAAGRHAALVAEATRRHGGQVVGNGLTGDSTLSVFARTSDAVSAALTLHRLLVDAAWPTTASLRVGMAIHTGEARIVAGDYVGPTVQRAAGLRALAGAGEILLSHAAAEMVADHLPPGVGLDDLGSRRGPDHARRQDVFGLRRH